MKSTSESLRNSQGTSTTMLGISMRDISKEKSGRTTRGISMKNRETNMLKVAGAGGQSEVDAFTEPYSRHGF